MRANERKSESIKTAITESKGGGWCVHITIIFYCYCAVCTFNPHCIVILGPLYIFCVYLKFIIFPLKFTDKKIKKYIFFCNLNKQIFHYFVFFFGWIACVCIYCCRNCLGRIAKYKSPGTRYSFIQLLYAKKSEWN